MAAAVPGRFLDKPAQGDRGAAPLRGEPVPMTRQQSDFARQAIEYSLATPEELEQMSAAFRRWASDAGGIFVVPSVEVLARL